MKEKSREKTLILIDGKSVFYRGFYAMPNLTTKDGTPTGGVYGFAVLALELFSRIKPDYVAVAWDKPKTNIRRRLKIYDKYKAGRHAPPTEFYAQIPLLRELLDALNWPFYEADDYEADDIIGTFALQAKEKNIKTIMISSDLDMLQLLDDNTDLFALKKGLANLEHFDRARFEEKYGIKIEQFLDVKALKGDSSDNIPGVAGIGEKTALNLISNFENLDNIYANLESDQIKKAVREKLISGRDSAYMSRELAKIWTDAPLELDFSKADSRNIDVSKLRNKLVELEFGSLLRKLPDFMRENMLDESEKESSVDIKKIEIKDFSEIKDKEKNDFANSKKIIVAISGDPHDIKGQTDLFNSVESKEFIIAGVNNSVAYKMSFEDFAKNSENKKIITHDLKNLAEKILKNGLKINFIAGFDTRHAAFLLNSLRQSVDLPTAINFAEMDENQNIRDMTDGEKIGATLMLYENQKKQISQNEKLYNLAKEVDFPLQILLAKIEQRGVKLDTQILQKMSEDLAVKISEHKKTIWGMVGREFNVSSPQQLSDALFNDLKLPTNGIKKSLRGRFSTGQKELDKLHGIHPIIEQIEEVRALLKMKNTYVDALPNLVDEKKYLHTNLRQDVTATGRLSSSNPNLQNIPTRADLGHKIRKAFIASEGKVLINADYSQFELRLAAALARDENMINLFSSVESDIHAATAAEAFNVPIDEVTSTQRRHAKVINFGVLYGMSSHGLAAATGMTFVEARNFIDRYFEIRKPIREFLDNTMKQAEEQGFVETLFGRRRPTPDVKSSNFMVRESAKRAAANMPIQGTEADLMKMAMLEIEKQIPEASQFMQIHDSIMVECEVDKVDEISRKMVDIMENICPEIGVKLRVDIKVGKTWAEL